MTLFSQTFSEILCNLTNYELLILFVLDFFAILRSYNQKQLDVKNFSCSFDVKKSIFYTKWFFPCSVVFWD